MHNWAVRLADGDRSAFEPLFETLLPLVEALCRRALGDPTEAQDAAQETMLRVFSRASELDRSRDALNWILGIAAYQCKTHRKRRRRRREEPAEGALGERPAPGPGQEEDLMVQSMTAAALEVLGTLRPADEETIRIAFSNGQRPDVPAATFRKRLQRALERLRTAWEARHGAL